MNSDIGFSSGDSMEKQCIDRVQNSTDELIISTKSLLNLTETGIRKTADNSRCVQVSLCKIFFFLFF